MPRRLAAARALFAAALCLLAFAPRARAQVWNETGDAGDLVSNAQFTIGAGSLTTINGTLSSEADVDVYCVQVGPTPRALGLPVVSLQCVVNQGPNVWIFDANGLGVATNETCQGGTKLVTTTTLSPGAPATVYVAVSYYGLAPTSPGGAIWLPAIGGERAPDGPGAAGALNAWTGTGVIQPNNPYQVVLGYAAYCDAATPAAAPTWGALKIRYGR